MRSAGPRRADRASRRVARRASGASLPEPEGAGRLSAVTPCSEQVLTADGDGANVVVHYHSSEAGARATAERVEQHGGKSLVVQADLNSWEAIKAMTATVWSHVGELDVLINNVGDIATDQMSWDEIDGAVLDRVLAVDIKGTMLMLHENGLRMLRQGRGAIVNIGSTVVVRGSPRAPQYAAGKYGMLGLTKSYAGAFRRRYE